MFYKTIGKKPNILANEQRTSIEIFPRGYKNDQQAYENVLRIPNNQRNANLNHNKVNIPVRIAIIENTRNNKVVEKKKHALLVGI
jgi:hypothetical protein